MRKRWAVIGPILMMVAGCTTVPVIHRAATTVPVITSTVAQPNITIPLLPTRTSVPAATLQPPSDQQPFSTTLQISQPADAVQTIEANGLLYLPADYGRDAQRRWPLIVFLHGAGERGDDLQRLTNNGLPQILQSRSDLPFVVVSPQLPSDEAWNDKGDMINALVDWIETQYAIDPQRTYLTGFSLGGFGTWALGLSSPDRFAALVPVAGGWEFGSNVVPSNICDLAAKPIWVFHGAQDETVNPAQSDVLVEALRACGSEVRYTLIPSATHAASGVLPYRDSDLYDWLLQQSLPTETAVLPLTATPESMATAGAPIDPAVPDVINTPLPGDGNLKPIGQHAYSIDLDIVGAKSVTRTATISYLLYLPSGYGQNPQEQWPLVLFLHGSGERGDNPEVLVAHGLPEILTTTLDFPAIVLSPQAPEDAVWWGAQLDEVSALLDHVQTHYAVDTKRVYLTGLSMGGFGAWAMALRYPRRFAALVPVAGGWDSERDIVPRNICDIKQLPVWAFHGAQDDIVLPKKSQLMVDALKQCGVEVRFTLYPTATHRESFERAYNDPELYAWMFEQHLP